MEGFEVIDEMYNSLYRKTKGCYPSITGNLMAHLLWMMQLVNESPELYKQALERFQLRKTEYDKAADEL